LRAQEINSQDSFSLDDTPQNQEVVEVQDEEIEVLEKCARLLMKKKQYAQPADLLEQALAAKRVNEDDPLAQ
jgi:hypothetical protein